MQMDIGMEKEEERKDNEGNKDQDIVYFILLNYYLGAVTVMFPMTPSLRLSSSEMLSGPWTSAGSS